MSIISHSACSLPIVTLVPNAPLLSTPVSVRRSTDVYITSYIQLECNESLLTNIRWTVRHCTPLCSSVPLALPSSIVTTLSELYVPARTLDYGTYELRMQVTMSAASQFTTTASVFVTIIPSTIIPNLMPAGTSMITLGRGQDLLLDPGTYSQDPDSTTFNASVSVHRCSGHSI